MNPKHNNTISNDTYMTAYPSRHFLMAADFWIPILLMVASFIVFRSKDLDMQLERALFSIHADWSMGDQPLLKFVYHFGNIPALLLALSGLVMFAGSFWKKQILPYRKIGLFLLLAMILGPGVIVNSILKDNWGRPRPREVIEFGGKYAYEPLLQYDASSTGKSFPCGHATTGFYLFVPWFLLRRKRKLLATLALSTGIVYGCLIGFARMAQGGHFASDVVWAGLIVYLSSYLLFIVMGLQRGIWYLPENTEPRKLKLHHKILAIALGVLLIAGVMIATPYSKTQAIHLDREDPHTDSLSISLELLKGDIVVSADSMNWISSNSNGFGFPGSKAKLRLQTITDENSQSVRIHQTRKGFFSEFNNRTDFYMTAKKSKAMKLKTAEGDIIVDVTKFPNIHDLECDTVTGNVIMTMPQGVSTTVIVNPEAKIDKQNNTVTVVTESANVQAEIGYHVHVGHGSLLIK